MTLSPMAKQTVVDQRERNHPKRRECCGQCIAEGREGRASSMDQSVGAAGAIRPRNAQLLGGAMHAPSSSTELIWPSTKSSQGVWAGSPQCAWLASCCPVSMPTWGFGCIIIRACSS
jgi:hypothetical protein